MVIDFATEPVTVLPSLSMAFSEEPWNTAENINHVNCLAYALNTPQLGFPFISQMLLATSNFPKSRAYKVARANFSKTAKPSEIYDITLKLLGFERIRLHQYDASCRHIVAYSVHLEHFYRLDGDNNWSHKPGLMEATQYDHMGKRMRSLESAALNPAQNREVPEEEWRRRQKTISTLKLSLAKKTDPEEISNYRELINDLKRMPIIPRNIEVLYYALPKEGIKVMPVPPSNF